MSAFNDGRCASIDKNAQRAAGYKKIFVFFKYVDNFYQGIRFWACF